MAGQLNLSLLISADAKGVAPATREARREIEGVAQSATQTTAATRLLATANEEAAASQRRAMDAARGRAAAERDLQDAVARVAGARPVMGDDGVNGEAMFRRTNLGYQGFDIAQSFAAGTPLAIIAAQQGPQIAQIYAGQGGLNALWKDTIGILGGLARAAGPWIAAAGLIYGAYRLIGSYSAEAALGIDEATAALAEQAAPIGTVKSSIGELAKLQDTYREAIRATATDATSATQTIIANTEREFNAKRALMELELRRQEASIKAQQAELAIAALQAKREVGQQVFTNTDLERRGFADPRIGSVPFIRLPDDISGLDKTFEVLESSPVNAKIKEMQANLTLTELAAGQLREAVKATFDGAPIDKTAQSTARARDRMSELAREADAYADALERLDRIAAPRLSDSEQALKDYQEARRTAAGSEESREALRRYENAQRRIANEEAGALAPIPTRRPNDIERLDAAPSARDFLRTQQEQLEQLRLEQALIGRSEEMRNRLTAALEAEQEIRRRGIDVNGKEANSLRRNAEAIADQTTAVDRMADAWGRVQDATENAIDTAYDKITQGDFKGALADITKDLTKTIVDLGAINPLKNRLLGTNYGTLDDVGGFSGILKRLIGGPDAGAGQILSSALGSNVAAMNVTAGTVMINGTPVGGPLDLTRLLPAANGNDPWSGMRGGETPAGSAGPAQATAGRPDLWREAIASIESRGSGDYAAIGRTDPTLGRALGRYQVMEANIGPWSRDALGRTITPGQFLANSRYQDAIFDDRFGGYVDQFGERGAAQAWFGGPGSVGKLERSDVLGTTVGGYGDKFVAAMDAMAGRSDKAASAIDGMSTNAVGASKDLGIFGNGLNQMGNALQQAPAAGGGGGSGGGFFDWIARLFGGGGGGASADPWGGMRVPTYAIGTSNHPGGPALIHDGGGEVVDLPSGARVWPRDLSVKMAEGGRALPAAWLPGGAAAAPASRAGKRSYTFTNAPAGNAVVEEEEDDEGNERINVTFSRMAAAEARRPGSPLNKQLRTMGARPPRIRR